MHMIKLSDSIRKNFTEENALFGDDFLRTLCKTLDMFFVDVDCHKEGEKILSENKRSECNEILLHK